MNTSCIKPKDNMLWFQEMFKRQSLIALLWLIVIMFIYSTKYSFKKGMILHPNSINGFLCPTFYHEAPLNMKRWKEKTIQEQTHIHITNPCKILGELVFVSQPFRCPTRPTINVHLLRNYYFQKQYLWQWRIH